MAEDRPILKSPALIQGGYYLLTGIWPLLSPSTFQKVTGPKVDFWLVNTVGILIAVIGGVVSLAGIRRRITPEIRLLAIGSALGLASIDIVYALRRRISPIYLLDALAELGLVAVWLSRSQNGPARIERKDSTFGQKTKEPTW